MEVHVKNPYGDTKTEFIAQKMKTNVYWLAVFAGGPRCSRIRLAVQIQDERYIW